MKQKTLDMIKRLTSLLLAFATCLGILPQFVSPAYAAGKEWRYIWLISQPSPLLCISSDNGMKQIKEVYIANMTTEADRTAGAPKRFLKCKEKTIDGEVYWVVDNDYAASSNADSPMADLVDQGAIDPLNAVQASDSTAYPDVGYVRLVSNFTNSTATDIKGWEDASFEYVPNSQKPFDPDTITEQNQDTTFWAGNKQGNEFATVTPGPDEWVNHIVSRVGRSDENQEYPGGYYPSFLNIRDLPRFDEPDTVYYAQIALRASDVAALVHEKDLAGEWEDGVCYINAPNNAQFQFKSVRELPDPERGNLIIRKIDSLTGKALANVSFKIEQVDGGYTSSIQTGGNGEATLDGGDLKTGSYIVTEINSATGHVLNTAPQTFAWVEGQKKDITLTFTNDPKGGVDIYKYDEDTNAALEGAAFDIYKDGKKISSLITDGTGHATINNLSEGHYQVIEVNPPAGYLKDTKPYEVYVDPADTNGEIIRKLNIPNHKKISLRILKVDAGSRTPLAGFQFDVTKDSQPYTSGTTDENGEIVLSTESGKYLKEGWYRVKEVQAPTGYIISGNDTQEVYLSNGNYATLTFQDQPLSALVIWKNDSRTGRGVEGATFQVRYLEGNSGTGGNVVATVKTGTNGSVSVTDLKPGTYIVEEIAAPNGYIIDTAPQTVFISGDEQKVVEVSFSDSPYGDLLIKKMDSVTKQPLQGVVFKVKTTDGTVVGNSNGEFATNEDGVILVNGIEPHTTLVINEISTIPGYVLDTTPKTVETIPGETVTVTFTDQPKSTLIVEKYDEVTGDPLQGVEFKIIPSDGKLLTDNEGLTSGTGLYTTDHNGQITTTAL